MNDATGTDQGRDTDVLVVGAGLACLALAGFCRQRGLRVDLVERVGSRDRAGYGIGLWGNGLRACDGLGVVRNALVAHTPILEWFVGRQAADDGAAWPDGEP